jgi:hypothetical protein
MLITCRRRSRLRRAKNQPQNLPTLRLVDFSLGYAVMASSRAEYFRGRAKDCCHSAIIAEDIERRLHWLEAAARWVSLARREGILLPAQTKAARSNDSA